MKRQLLIASTLTVLTLVWAVGVPSFAQTSKPASAPAAPSEPHSAPRPPELPANQKQPIKPLPPDMERGSMSGVGSATTYPDLARSPSAR